MKKFILPVLMLFLVCSCQAPRTESPLEPSPYGLLVLNNGNWGGNDASLCVYSTEDKTLAANVFEAANGRRPGDLGQDMIIVGDELYIAMNGSQLIYVCDRNYTVKDELRAYSNDIQLSPRCLLYARNRVYVTYYEGYLGEIDPDTHKMRLCAVGANPEGLCYAAGKIYVANSGGALSPDFNNTLSVVDPVEFKQVSSIEVNTNPVALCADSAGKWIYILSYGNYSNIRPMLQAYDIAAATLSDCPYNDVKSLAMGPDDVLYLACGFYDDLWQVSGSLYCHDASANKPLGTFGAENFTPYYSLSVDASSGEVYVGCSDYKTNGDVYVLDSEGKILYFFDCAGLNPQKVLKLYD